MLLVGEVAPLAPLLIPVGEVVLWATFLALCLGAVYVARAFFGTANSAVSWIPYAGKVLSQGIQHTEHKLVSILSGAAASADAKMGAALHQLARVVEWIGHEIEAHASLLWTLSQVVLGSGLTALLRVGLAHLHGRVRVIEAYVAHVLHRITAAERAFAHSINVGVYPRLRALEHEAEHVLPHDIAELRARTRALEDGAAKAFDWIRAHPLSLATGAFTGAVAIALGRLGLGWLRCNSLGKIGRRLGCGGFSLLDDLLAGIIDVLVIADLCDITKGMVAVANSTPIRDSLDYIATGITSLMACQGSDLPAALPVVTTPLPPAQSYAALPAVSGG